MSRKQRAGKLMYGGPDGVLWKIQDFFSLLEGNEAYIISPSFSHGNKSWCMQFYFGTHPQRTCDTEDFVCLSAAPMSHHNVQHFVYKCELRKEDGTPYSSVDFVEFHMNTAYLLSVSDFFVHASEIACKGSVTLYVEFRHKSQWSYLSNSLTKKCPALSEGRQASSLESTSSTREGQHFKCLDVLSQNLKDMYVKGQHCDVTFQVGDQELHAHKLILASRSPAFASMLEIKEENGKVKVEDCEPEVFNKFLLYLYSGKVDSMSASDAIALYTLSDKYKVDPLKPVCIARMKKTLTVDNFCEVIEVASNYAESDLLKYLKKFFIKNAKFILSTEKWSSLMKEDSELVNQLFLLVVSHCPAD